ncbi:segregation/condensation protein A [Hydrococcus rivularis NIES-593]|uniref:Segregation and condensation protein A n=2 Tax=Hydrococcus TaxID=1616833 RepID=A0A1U7HQ19_9CYAN|nr:segregation/condensation protein A [Hydrococcus rivularis]OKH25659.1 segregation/condensation protein A [Hydrococcus rivularis NIES-593]
MITPAQEAIATLIELAQNGEINPWDVPAIDIIDRFLRELGLPDEIDAVRGQANLPKFGQAFLWASMLVLLKADTLASLEADEEDIVPEELELLLEEENSQRSLPRDLERHIRRRASAPPLRKRRVTLQELIAQIEQIAAELEKVSDSAAVVERSRPQSRREAIRTIAQLAHQENLTELASQLEQFLTFELPQLAPEKTQIELEELLNWWAQSSLNDARAMGETPKAKDKVGVFWALLLLCSQSKVELSQAEFYQDLTIQVVR